MFCLLQFAIICTTLAQYSFGAPWDINNDIKEYDIEWQCQQFCDRLNGELDFNSKESSCVCTVNTKNNIDFNAKYLEHKLHDIGLNFKIIDHANNTIVKRQVSSDENPERPQSDQQLTIAKKIQKLREKLQAHKKEENKIITAPENNIIGSPNPNLGPAGGKKVIVEPAEVDPLIVDNPKEEPLKEEPPKEVKIPEIPTLKNNDKFNGIRAKLEALKNKSIPSPEEPKELIVGSVPQADVGSPKEIPSKEETPKEEVLDNSLPAHNDKLEEIRAKLAAFRNKDVPPPPSVGNALLEPEKTEDHPKAEIKFPEVPLAHHNTLNDIRVRLAAVKNKKLHPSENHEEEHKMEPIVGNALTTAKPLAERLKEFREKVRMRLQNRNHNNLPNADGHVKDGKK